mgnify:CR=1 FL=1
MLPRDVTDLLPQKKPFKMVDTLIFADAKRIQTSFTIQPDNVLVDDGVFTEGGMIENMAQSAAAGTGYFFTSQNKEVPIGYIGALKNVQVWHRAQIGDTIETELETLHTIGNATIVSGKIFFQKELFASCELTIFVQEN